MGSYYSCSLAFCVFLHYILPCLSIQILTFNDYTGFHSLYVNTTASTTLIGRHWGSYSLFLMAKYSVMNILAQITLNISFLQISAALIPRKRTAELKDRHIYPFVGTAKMPSKRNSIKKKRLHQFVYSSTEE